MAKKPMKIKRYSKRMRIGKGSSSRFKKPVLYTLAILALLVIGYFIAPLVLNKASSMWYDFKNGTKSKPKQQTAREQPEQTPLPAEETSGFPGDDQSDVTDKISVYTVVNPSQLTSSAQIQEVAAQLKEKGVTTAVVTLKNETGNIFYSSQNPTAAAAKADILVNLSEVGKIFAENGITPCANIYVFMDKTTPAINRATAVKYQGTDLNWLDNSKEFGGKPWANPASGQMHEYIYFITDEILSAGFKEIIYSGVQLPTGYSLDKCDYGVPSEQVLAYMKEFINSAQTKVSSYGAFASFAFDLSAFTGTNYTKYIVSPTRLGAENLIMVGRGEEIANEDISALVDKLNSNEDISRLVIWQTDGNSDNVNGNFKGYFIQ